ncbi:hypothetical protein HPP92_020858 [Vanilla planifolia]|uniref:Bifunctional inhibitor/plant lipid transfer protein/seed storage helical domain-containing protein n=1 Tax=Vanilla planifolia TaxID=51239 RepID=A0A835PW44_VANPL|nr:hypothetical protein HPP92_021161 [Vanilla planifolia]KAG0462382.1 hypothetical protein HPP92_020858 [Vanilla planifolia]
MWNGSLFTLSLLLPFIMLTMSSYGVQASVPAASLMSFAPSPAPTGLDCFDALTNLTSCLTYVEEGSNLTKPEKGCCPALAGLVKSQPICLCQLLSNSNTFGIAINDTKALSLPAVCRVKTPPVSLCSAFGIPVPSPVAISPGGARQPELAPAIPTAAQPISSGLHAGLSTLTILLAIVSQEVLFFF